jgi:hypothetical protein
MRDVECGLVIGGMAEGSKLRKGMTGGEVVEGREDLGGELRRPFAGRNNAPTSEL